MTDDAKRTKPQLLDEVARLRAEVRQLEDDRNEAMKERDEVKERVTEAEEEVGRWRKFLLPVDDFMSEASGILIFANLFETVPLIEAESPETEYEGAATNILNGLNEVVRRNTAMTEALTHLSNAAFDQAATPTLKDAALWVRAIASGALEHPVIPADKVPRTVAAVRNTPDREELMSLITAAITDSYDVDWQGEVAAQYILAALQKRGFEITRRPVHVERPAFAMEPSHD